MKIPSLIAALILCAPLAAAAQAPASKPALPTGHPPVGAGPQASEKPSPWSALAEYTLTVTAPRKGETGTWTFHTYADAADVLIDVDTPGAKGRTQGTLLLVSGSAIATKGLALEKGFELDPLDVAVVNLKILTRLLDVAVPGGPAALEGKRPVKARGESTPIMAATPSASAKFAAPWSLAGTVERVDATRIAFRLEIEVPKGDKAGERERWIFSGKAGGSARDRALDETMSLAGWTAYRIGPPKEAKQSHTTLRFAANKLPGPIATVKDLRAAVQ